VGAATVTVDNRDGLFDFPLSMEDLADDQTLLSIRPGRSIRIGVEIDMPVLGPPRTVFLWAGYIDGANPTYDAVEGARLVLECIDAKGDAGRAEVAALASPTGAGQTVTQRINTILDAAGWPPYRRAIDTTGVTLIATELGSQCVDLLNIAADSGGGSIFGDLGDGADGDPRVAYRQRDFPNYSNSEPPHGTIGDFGYPGVAIQPVYTVVLTDDGSGLVPFTGSTTPVVTFIEAPAGSYLCDVSLPPDVVFVETPAAGLIRLDGGGATERIPADVCPSNWELTFNRADITTQALLGRQTDDTPRVYPTPAMEADLTNGTKYGLSMFGVEPFKRTDLETLNDADLDWFGERVLTNRSWKFMPRVNAVTVTAKTSAPDTISLLADASPFLPARYRCQHRIDGRVVFNRVMLVTGVEHSISPAGWESRIALDDAEPFLVGGAQPVHWDETDIAEWDSATWADPT
jgi:hypothetical protein